MSSRSHIPVLAALAVSIALALSGCQAKRSIVVTSDPPGAEVRLDGSRIGETPVEEPFLHYGTRRVTLYLDGYLTHSEVLVLQPPWYGRFPFDLFSEMLVPVGWVDRREMHADLEFGQSLIETADLQSVLDRSESLRRAGPEGPQPPPAAPDETEVETEPETESSDPDEEP